MTEKLNYYLTPEFYAQLKIFFGHIKEYRKQMSLSLLLSLSSSALSLIPALITGIIIDRYLGRNTPA